MRIRTILLAATVSGAALLAPPFAADGGAYPPRFDSIRLATGVRMHFAEQGRADGEPVIMLHGYSDSWFSFSRVLPLMPDAYRVYALDMRGHGRSDAPASGYGMDDLAGDVLAFMDAKGIGRATIVGHSMGGFVAQQVARAAPGRVSRLVIISSAPAPRRFAGIDDLAGAVASLGDTVPRAFVEEFQYSTIHQPMPDEFMQTVIAESLRLPGRVWHGLMEGMLAMEPAVSLGGSAIPTLLVWGEKDPWAPRAEQDSLIAMIGTARLEEVRNVSHAPHWERPDEFVRLLSSFFGESRRTGE